MIEEFEKADYDYERGSYEEKNGNLQKNIETFKEIPIEATVIREKGNIEIKKITSEINDEKISNSTNKNTSNNVNENVNIEK